MTTFSQLVDELVIETRRPDLRSEIATYLNQTIREIHFEPSRGNAVFYSSNRTELQITTDSESAQVWTIPDVTIFQGMEAVEYPDQFLGIDGFAKEIKPGPSAQRIPFYYYRAGPSFVFGGTVGYGGVGSHINLSFYQFPKALKYKAAATTDPYFREAEYDVESGWTYHTVNSIDYSLAENQQTAQDRVTNWLLLRWADVIREGLRAKVYKRLSDQLRATLSYSLYQNLRQGIFTSEVAELQGG